MRRRHSYFEVFLLAYVIAVFVLGVSLLSAAAIFLWRLALR